MNEDLSEWQNHPVTKRLLEEIREKQRDLIKNLMAYARASGVSVEHVGAETISLVSQYDALSWFLDVIEDEDEDTPSG